MSVTARVIHLYETLHRHGELQTHEAARHVGEEVRTTREDLQRLREAELVESRGLGTDTTWVIKRPSPLASATAYDAVCIRVGRDLLGFLQPLGLNVLHRADADHRLQTTWRANLDKKLHVIHEPARHTDDAQAAEVFDAVLDGLLRDREIVLHREGKAPRRVQPLSLVVHRRGLYLQCLRAGDPEPVLFALDRIASVEDTGVVFQRPAHDPRHHFRDVFGVYASGPTEDVTLWFPPDRADLATARTWHPSQRVRHNDDGSVELDLRCRGPELVSFVLAWGPACRVLRGDWLRRRVTEELRAALGAYGEGA